MEAIKEGKSFSWVNSVNQGKKQCTSISISNFKNGKRNQWEGRDVCNHSQSRLIERFAKYKVDNNDYKYKRSASLLTDAHLLSWESHS